MKYLLTLLMILPLFLMGQNYPRNYFSAPLDTPLVITGTFGEIRDNHLHSGLDLSTNEDEGLPVSAAADGYVSRVKISAGGYGKALYITHPNGYVTVYGHLEKFTGPVNEFVRRLQYERQTFELDENPGPTQFPVKQREVIAYSGSSGSAEDAHLHFEIRDEKTEEPVNPLLFGFRYNDSMAPVISSIRIIPQSEEGVLNNSDNGESFEIIPDNVTGLKLNTDNYPVVFGKISFAIDATDSVNGYDGGVGIYSAELFIDENPVFTFRFDRLNFNHTRDVNAHIDYLTKGRDRDIFERFARLPGDRLYLYGPDTAMTGIVDFDENMVHDVRMVVRDFKSNTTELNFQIIARESVEENIYEKRNPDAIPVTYDKGVALHKENHDVVITDGSVYDDFYYDEEVERSNKYLSDLFRIGDEYIPLRKPITIGIKPNTKLPDSLKSKELIILIDQYDIVKPLGGQWSGDFLTAKSNAFGRFAIALDTVPPMVEKFYTPADMNGMYGGEVRIKITDDMSGIKSYSGKVDGKWRLFEYDLKNNLLISNIDPVMNNTLHPMEITVTDESGNTTVWKSSFYF